MKHVTEKLRCVRVCASAPGWCMGAWVRGCVGAWVYGRMQVCTDINRGSFPSVLPRLRIIVINFPLFRPNLCELVPRFRALGDTTLHHYSRNATQELCTRSIILRRNFQKCIAQCFSQPYQVSHIS